MRRANADAGFDAAVRVQARLARTGVVRVTIDDPEEAEEALRDPDFTPAIPTTSGASTSSAAV